MEGTSRAPSAHKLAISAHGSREASAPTCPLAPSSEVHAQGMVAQIAMPIRIFLIRGGFIESSTSAISRWAAGQ
jgi:hypothetical protein